MQGTTSLKLNQRGKGVGKTHQFVKSAALLFILCIILYNSQYIFTCIEKSQLFLLHINHTQAHCLINVFLKLIRCSCKSF